MNYRWELRLKNLLWTVSGDYTLDIRFEDDKWEETPWSALYDAVKEGAYARYFGEPSQRDGGEIPREMLSLYLLKKIYMGAEEEPLMAAARLCVDAAVGDRMNRERRGAAEIRKKCYDELLDLRFERLVSHPLGQLQLLWMKTALGGSDIATDGLTECLQALRQISADACGMDLIRAVDRIYNRLADPRFEAGKGTLSDVLAVTLEDLKEFDWKDFLNEEALEQTLDEYRKQLENQVTESTPKSGRRSGSGTSNSIIQISEEEQKKRKDYIALNFGSTYLAEEEEYVRQQLLCRGAHAESRLYYTEGILKASLKRNYQYEYVRRQTEMNHTYYRRHQNLARKSIGQLTETLRKSLLRRTEPESRVADSGAVIPDLLWKVGRVETDRLFRRIDRQDQMDFVVDILIDGSGSQRSRQSQVAVQAYIISEALSNLKIPHRVMSFCSFWNTTVLQRFRDYDDGPEKNKNIFELFATSNNRDGLAIRAAAYDLLKKPQEGKVLIVLSDGRPNDKVIYREKGQEVKSTLPIYGDEYAVRDTAHEVRRIRSQGVSVLGVFAGEEEDLLAERKIFGKDFAYIRDIGRFSHIVAKYMKQLLEEI